MKFWTVLIASVLTFGALDADAARRLGGGGSVGRQSSNVTQRQATPPANTPDAPAAQRSASPQPAPAPTAAQAPRSRWGGILGGLAAGLGLAALAHALGFGAGFANFLLFLLVGMLILVAIGMMRRRAQQPVPAGAAGHAYRHSGLSADAPASPPQYNPHKVGNDASARPWESGFDAEHARQAAGGIRIGSALGAQPQNVLQGSQGWGIPAGFDTEGFLNAAKRNFTTLQDAWDRGDVATLRGMMTDEMLHEIRNQLADRDRQPAAVQKTEVAMLEAQLLGIEELATEYMASVEFSGMIREEPSAGPAPFREVWNMVKPKDGSAGWLVAGVQALQ